MPGFKHKSIVCAALELFLLVLPIVSPAQEFTFAPTIVHEEGNLEFDWYGQTNEYSSGNTNYKTSGSLFREKLYAGLSGYIYHPRFQTFQIKVTPALNEWNITSDEPGTPSGKSTDGTVDYELRTIFLPDHPYNLALFALHTEAAAPGTFWQGLRSKVDEKGATFDYKFKPVFFSANYDDLSLDSSIYKTDSKMYRVNAAYSTHEMTNSAGYSHALSESSLATHNTRDFTYYANTLHVKDIELDSRINETTSNQLSSEDLTLQQRTLFWTEQLYAPLPWNFSTTAYYGYQDEHDRTVEPPLPNTEDFNRSTNQSYSLTHRLYRSLVTAFTYNELSTTSSAGQLSARTDTLMSTYTKNIPSGTFTAAIQLSNGETVRTGLPQILNEIHNSALLASFSLTVQNIIESSIVVQVKDPVTGILITLPAGNYIITQIGTTTQITVESVSPATLEPDPTYVYEFHVTYSLSNDSKIDITNIGYSFKVDLLANLLSLYYNYLESKQKLVSGSIPGGTDQSINEIAGITVSKGPYSGLIEHDSFRSLLNPSDAWKTRTELRNPLTQDINFSAAFTFVFTNYLPSSAAVTVGRRETDTGATLGLDMKFPSINLTFFAVGGYSETRSVIDNETLSFNSYATWQLGLLSVSAGAQVSHGESTYVSTRTTLTSSNYYVTVTRKLF
ncbi:MAG TPA: hypothetical protein VEI57_12900 [Nitrospirota bacterium]|nr:hypothetical protein [Nitrospirota bacterium]